MAVYRKEPGPRKMRGGKLRKTIRRGAIVAREALSIYSDMKGRKGPLAVGLGLLSTWGAVEDLIDGMGKKQVVVSKLHDMDLTLVLPRMAYAMYDTLKDLDFNMPKVLEDVAGAQEGEHVVMVDLYGTEIYFHHNGNYVDAIFARCEEDVVQAFSQALHEKMGRFIGVSATVTEWYTNINLVSVPIDFEFYSSNIDEEAYIKRVLKAQEELGMNRSSLFYGPPGVGKSTFAAKVAERLEGRLLIIDARMINLMTDYNIPIDLIINMVDPVVILFDDMDYCRDLGNLLGDIQNLNKQKRSKKNLIIGSVNNLKKIPKAMRRPQRFDEIIEFKVPDAETRKELLRGYGEFFGTRLCNGYIDELVKLTEGMSHSHLREVMVQGSLRSYESLTSHVAEMQKILAIGEEEDRKKDGANRYVTVNETPS